MLHRPIRLVLLAGLLISLSLSAGCQDEKFSTTILNPFNLQLPFLPYQEPVRVGIVHRRGGLFDPSTWDLLEVGSPWTPLRIKLQRHLRAPVQIEDLKPFQVAAHLQSGRLDLRFWHLPISSDMHRTHLLMP